MTQVDITVTRADVDAKNLNLYWDDDRKVLVGVADIRGEDYGDVANVPRMQILIDDNSDGTYAVANGGYINLNETLSKTQYTRHEIVWDPLTVPGNTSHTMVQSAGQKRDFKLRIVDENNFTAKELQKLQLEIDLEPAINYISPKSHVVGNGNAQLDIIYTIDTKAPNKFIPKVVIDWEKLDGTTGQNILDTSLTQPTYYMYEHDSAYQAFTGVSPNTHLYDLGKTTMINSNYDLNKEVYFNAIKVLKHQLDISSYPVGTKLTIKPTITSSTV